MEKTLFNRLKKCVPDSWVDGDFFIPDIQRFLDGYLNKTTSYNIFGNLRDILRTLSNFCQLVSKHPSTILDEQEQDQELPRRKQTNPIIRFLNQFVQDQQNKNLAHNTIVTRVAFIRSWLKSNNISLNGFSAPQPRLVHEPIQMTKELAYESFLSADSVRNRAIIHTFWETGLSLSDLTKLDRTDIQTLDDWGYAQIHRTKTNHRFVVVFPPDCLESIKRYLNQRTDDNPALFVTVDGKRRLQSIMIQIFLIKLAKKMGLKTNGIHAHNFRKGSNRCWKLAGAPVELIEYIQARKMGVRSHYADYSPQEVIQALKPYYQAIQFNGQSKKATDLEKKVALLTEQVERLMKLVGN